MGGEESGDLSEFRRKLAKKKKLRFGKKEISSKSKSPHSKKGGPK